MLSDPDMGDCSNDTLIIRHTNLFIEQLHTPKAKTITTLTKVTGLWGRFLSNFFERSLSSAHQTPDHFSVVLKSLSRKAKV